jgi:hypothetical protein
MAKSSAFEIHQNVLRKYIPDEFVDYTVELILRNPLELRIVRPRKTKLGDFRYGHGLKRPIITINGDLNPYSFLITTLHELSHYFTFLDYGNRIKAHGKEWQNGYSKLIYPVIETGHLPKDIEHTLLQSLVNVKASSCTDLNLYRVLKSYNRDNHLVLHLEDLAENEKFLLSGKIFAKGKLRRKRYLCMEVKTRKNYLVSAIAEVEKIEE